MTYCINCRQDHDVEATDLHQAPCLTCGSDGHARCQHGHSPIPCLSNCGNSVQPGVIYCARCLRERQAVQRARE